MREAAKVISAVVFVASRRVSLVFQLEDCRLCDDDQLEWDGFIEIQSGDVLLVKIDDSYLIHPEVVFNESQEDTSDSHRLVN